MFQIRALRQTALRMKTRQVGKGWGPKSGINDASKVLWSIVLLAGSSCGSQLLQAWMSDSVDPVLLSVFDLFASFALIRVLFFAARRPILRLLLSAQPWARPRHSPFAAACWEAALALLQPGNASTAYLVRLLPHLPCPGPAFALQKYLDVLGTAASAKAKDAATTAVHELLRRGEHVLAQEMGRCVKDDGTNWAWACTWKQLVVQEQAPLLGRCYYLLDRLVLPESLVGKQAQFMRATVLTMRLLDFMKRVSNDAVPCRGLMCRADPVPKIVPRCIQAFETLFATSIEPCEDTGDPTLRRRDFQSCSHHIVVLCHGQAVEVPVRDSSGARVSEEQLMALLLSAEVEAQRRDSKRNQQRPLDVDRLAWLPWSEWSEAVSCIELQRDVPGPADGRSMTGIEKLRSAALVLALDSSLPSWPQAKDLLSNRALALLLGPSPACRGAGRWRGSAFCLVVQPDGYAGLCCTLPLAEPWAACQMWEFALSKERYPISSARCDAEVAQPICLRKQAIDAATDLTSRTRLQRACASFSEATCDVSLRVIHIKNIGWRMVQGLKVAPPALFHLAAHVALFRVQGKISMTLDCVPTRLFSGGRSDWICTTRDPVVKFVVAFCNRMQSKNDGEERKVLRSLLVHTCKTLDMMRRETALGQGFYRFLLALRGSASSSQRRTLFQALVPAHQPSDDEGAIAPVGLSTLLCEVQSDPKTPLQSLSLGCGGGFCMASNSGGCRISVVPVGDFQLVFHVFCSNSNALSAGSTQAATRDPNDHLHPMDEDFVDCTETEEIGGAALEEGHRSPRRGDRASTQIQAISADSVAREMERALYDLVDLLQRVEH